MAKNLAYEPGRKVTLPVPVGTLSGGPVRIGTIVGVAQNDRDADGESVIDTEGTYEFAGIAGTAPTVGAIIYITPTNTLTTVLTSNFRFGYAIEQPPGAPAGTWRVLLGTGKGD